MKRLCVSFSVAAMVAGLLIVGCTQAAPQPAPTAAPAKPAAQPTAAPAAPTKPPAQPTAAPTKAPALQPTAVPAKKVEFPEKGKTVTIIVPYAAGGGGDVAARLLAVPLEKALGAQVMISNKAGAGTQVGITELAKSKPDGYTIASTNLPTTTSLYLDPDRKAVFGRKDLLPLALFTYDQLIVATKSDSPYKSFKDVIDAAKANPGKVKASDVGILTQPHLGILLTEQLTGVQFATVHYQSSAEGLASLLGGHTDVLFAYANNVAAQVQSKEVTVLGVMGKEENKYLPGVKTMEAQGYKLHSYIYRGFALPGGVPKEVVGVLEEAFKKSIADPELVKKMEDQMYSLRYMGSAEFTELWDSEEKAVKPLIELAKKAS